jgi:glycosyltransferase involved in cell wall biosynthesis
MSGFKPPMAIHEKPVRVLYSFPHKLGAERICYTAWQQVNGLAAADVEVLACPGALHRPVPQSVKVWPTLAWGKFRIPHRLLGRIRACALHDYIVSRRIKGLAGQIDIIHTWPLGALRTLRIAARLGIPAVLERPNVHTRFAYETVQKECERLGISMPSNHEHAFNAAVLKREESEYRLADRLLCPSDFVAKTFRDRGFVEEKLARHQYGFDDKVYYPDSKPRESNGGLTFLFAGGCAPRKGLHYALDAWLKSSAHKKGTFLIAGGFIPGYAECLSTQLAHPSVKVLGYRSDLPDLMRGSDVFVLPSVEEGSALVTSEARGSGCVLLVSDASGAICKHMENALIHHAGDVRLLSEQITLLDENRDYLLKLREASLRTASEITWLAAGYKLAEVYSLVLDQTRRDRRNEYRSGTVRDDVQISGRSVQTVA